LDRDIGFQYPLLSVKKERYSEAASARGIDEIHELIVDEVGRVY